MKTACPYSQRFGVPLRTLERACSAGRLAARRQGEWRSRSGSVGRSGGTGRERIGLIATDWWIVPKP